MTTITYVTQKGQVTIPKNLREKYNIKANDALQFEEGKGHIKVKRIPSILDIAPLGHAPKGKSALKAREYMEKHYERV